MRFLLLFLWFSGVLMGSDVSDRRIARAPEESLVAWAKSQKKSCIAWVAASETSCLSRKPYAIQKCCMPGKIAVMCQTSLFKKGCYSSFPPKRIVVHVVCGDRVIFARLSSIPSSPFVATLVADEAIYESFLLDLKEGPLLLVSHVRHEPGLSPRKKGGCKGQLQPVTKKEFISSYAAGDRINFYYSGKNENI